jgi:DNA repair protein RecN (Recombination protein N)
MLRQLTVHDFVLVERLELEFERGLGVLTGETGAGKSILLDALGLALGARADNGLIRAGSDGAAVSAELDLPTGHPARECLSALGIAADPGEPLIVRRTLKGDGASRAFAAGAAVPASVLRDIGVMAVEIHGQHDDRGLLNPKGHRALLDAFGSVDSQPVSEAWAEVVRIEAALTAARAAFEAAERDREWLDHASREIDALAPEEGEESRLAEERAAIQAGLKAGDSLSGIDELLAGSDGAVAQLRQAARKIERAAVDHPLLAEALAALDRAVIEASEAEDRIARAADSLAFDPSRLEHAETRLFDIRALARKHRVEPDALATLGEQMRSQLADIDAGGERLAALERELAAARAGYQAAA